MLKVPAAMPVFAIARSIASATYSAVTIWPGCAFTTTEHPAASAEAVSPPATENAIGKWRRLALRLCAIDPRTVEVAPAHCRGEEPHLAACALALAFQARRGQRGLTACFGDE